MILLMGLFPPWQLVVEQGGTVTTKSLGHYFILFPAEHLGLQCKIDIEGLMLHWGMIVAITGFARWVTKGKKHE